MGNIRTISVSIILFDNDQGFVGLNYGKETNTQFLKGQWLKKVYKLVK